MTAKVAVLVGHSSDTLAGCTEMLGGTRTRIVPSTSNWVVSHSRPGVSGGREKEAKPPVNVAASNRLNVSPSTSGSPVAVTVSMPP